jgi:GNAT superfamily N-acetyltransferase
MPLPQTRMVLREANAEDVAMVVPLFDAYRMFYGAASDLLATQAFLEARQLRAESILIVALHEDTSTGREIVTGFAQLYPCFSSISLRRVYILNDLFVLPAWRRAKVARQLVVYSAQRAAAYGAIRLELATQHTNAPARSLYDALGFTADVDFTHMSLELSASA